ncbi:MAG: hypothetical protein JEZ03_17955 [Bacteroidales bacterium]|nr:hypothetical protein [Bacteroidales bacterium]
MKGLFTSSFIGAGVVFCISVVFVLMISGTSSYYYLIQTTTPGAPLVWNQPEIAIEDTTDEGTIEIDKTLAVTETKLQVMIDTSTVEIPETMTSTLTQTEVIAATNTKVVPTNTITNTPFYTSTPTLTVTNTLLPSSTFTPRPSSTTKALPTSTPDIPLSSTEKAAPMYGLVKQLYAGDIISSDQGSFQTIPDYSQSWNDTETYQKTYIQDEYENFVLTAHATWEVYEKVTPTWIESGCGVVFRDNEENIHYLVYFSLGGRAYFNRSINESLERIGLSYLYDIDRDKGVADIIIVVEGEWTTIFVNGEQIWRKPDRLSDHGKVALTTFSGISKGFGTKCEMTNVGIWDIESVE